MSSFRTHRAQWIILAALALLFLLAAQGMSTRDWLVTVLRGLSVAAVTFLVASGFSIIFGLMDVLNLAHGALFMLGAYVGWTAYVRPDTVIDLATPVLLFLAGFALSPALTLGLSRIPARLRERRAFAWGLLAAALLVLYLALPHAPMAAWHPGEYTDSPIVWTQTFEAERVAELAQPAVAEVPAWLVWSGILLGGLLLAASLIAFNMQRRPPVAVASAALRRGLFLFLALLTVALLIYGFNTPLTAFMLSLSSNWLFLFAIVMAVITGVGLGGLMESTLIRPLYERALYQIMLTFGLAFIGTEIVRAVWGRSGFTMPKPELFAGRGEGCPATSIGGWLQHHCSTIVIEIAGEKARIRTYNELFLIVMGVLVLVVVWLILQRTRLGMIIRAGVQDSEMVEALGIDVRRVFTLVFALGVGLAALGGVLAAPATGLSDAMGAHVLLTALIALAIGGLTSYPGAAVGSLIVGLMQQFIIKYGQIGIQLPFMDEPFKPTPPLVPASTVLLMVVVLLLMPQGLFGRRE
ncbi:MAG: branched-chain amino acid ABC transporter permease [Chloroflexi bacterium]|nr:branched-chain amino acid ABC transporter permease [Chloroflexota bacterium]